MGRKIAFFDMDLTLVAANTGTLYVQSLRRDGEIGVVDLARAGWLLLRYKLALVDMASVSARWIRDLKGSPEAKIQRRCDQLFSNHVQHLVYQEAMELIDKHRSDGHQILVLSASSPYLVRPLVQYLGLDGFRCTMPHVQNGNFTGEFDDPICYGEGKVVWAERCCEEFGCSLSDCTFYTDSYSDLPLLLKVGNPVATNPDPRLRATAKRKGWPILEFVKPISQFIQHRR
ncbi:MAG: HAD family hydrolase [Myxococcales bacterium]|nr:HAD family hydrolase [Myxococcales bacterium]